MSVEKLIDVPGLLLYPLEIAQDEVLLVFLQVPSVTEVFDAPFIDRGVRALVETGSTVYVARLDAVERMPGFVPIHKLPSRDQARFSIVWNTSRCGSTPMHKMLRKLGVLSFSEPYWLDKIEYLPSHGMDHGMIGRVLGVCVAMDVSLARRSLPAHPPAFGATSTLGSGHVSFNFKSKGYLVMGKIMKALLNARHMMMYRDARQVIESFGSIFQEEQSSFGKLLGMFNPWRRPNMMIPPPKKGTVAPTFSGSVGQTLCMWNEVVRIGIANSGSTASLRMSEFTGNDPVLIESIIRFFLGDDVDVDEDTVATSLEPFNTHSQAGNLVVRSSHNPSSGKARFLSLADVREIERATKASPVIGSPDYIIPGSLGAPAF